MASSDCEETMAASNDNAGGGMADNVRIDSLFRDRNLQILVRIYPPPDSTLPEGGFNICPRNGVRPSIPKVVSLEENTPSSKSK